MRFRQVLQIDKDIDAFIMYVLSYYYYEPGKLITRVVVRLGLS